MKDYLLVAYAVMSVIALVLAIILTIATPIMHRRSGLQTATEPLDVSFVESD